MGWDPFDDRRTRDPVSVLWQVPSVDWDVRGDSVRGDLRMKYLRCPQCRQKGVRLKMGREDWWVCRYRSCGWSVCNEGEDQQDVDGRRSLADINPQAEVWVTDAD